MRHQSTIKKVELQTRQEKFNYHIAELQSPLRKDISIPIQRLIKKSDTIEAIADALSEKNLPISKRRIYQLVQEAK